MCRNGENGRCTFGFQNYWFKHDYNEMAFNSDNLTKENNEVFGMLKKMTERLLLIERCNITY